jgi:urea transporter
VLTAIAVGTVFCQPNWRFALYAAVGTAFTVIVQVALNVALTPFAIPALTAPFVLVTWMLLLPGGVLRRAELGRPTSRHRARPGSRASDHCDGNAMAKPGAWINRGLKV